MIISQEKKILFVHIQKTGGTTITSILNANITDAKQMSYPHSHIIEAASLLGSKFNDYYKFAFVRNPWDRLLSW